MSFYLGTKIQCQQYDQEVSSLENYQQPTQNWFTPVLISNDFYAVMKHPSYPSTLEEVESISELINANI